MSSTRCSWTSAGGWARVPRAGLTTVRVTAEAAAVADEVGWDHLTLALVADRCGVRLPSLYKHIDSLGGLRASVSAMATAELAASLADATVGRAGPDALRSLADAYREFGGAHPGRYAATVRAPDPEHADHAAAAASALRTVTAVLSGFGLADDDLVDAARAVRAALHGFVTLEAAGGFGLPVDVDRSFERLAGGLCELVAAWAEVPP